MAYRNDKRRAAIWLLTELLKPSKYKIEGFSDPLAERYDKVDKKQYGFQKFADLVSKSKYSKEILKSAVEMAFNNGHLRYAEQNHKDDYDFTLQLFESGEEALKEEFYEDEIEIYDNDKYYRYLRWWLPLLAIIISVLSLCISTCKGCNGSTNKEQCLTQPTKQQKLILKDTLNTNNENPPKTSLGIPDTTNYSVSKTKDTGTSQPQVKKSEK